MRVVNAMFGRKKGGIEQTFIDYSKALADLGCEVVAVVYQDAEILKLLPDNVTVKTITNFGQWDPLAGWKLKKIIKEIAPDVIITHGNRATTLFNDSIVDVPTVIVCHNHNIKPIPKDHAIITITEDLKNKITKKGANEDYIYTVPNMIYLPQPLPEKIFSWNKPPVIGAMGNLVSKKGFDFLIKALSLLKNRHIDFRAVIAGEGIELENLKKLTNSLGLEDLISFPGWIEDKNEFFSSIDIFCLPSIQEPFGNILLEAFLHTLPVITTNTEGPIEIVRPHIDALMVETREHTAITDSIEKFLRNPNFAERVAKEGFKKVISTYDSKMVGRRIYTVLDKIIRQYQELNNIKVSTEIKDMEQA